MNKKRTIYIGRPWLVIQANLAQNHLIVMWHVKPAVNNQPIWRLWWVVSKQMFKLSTNKQYEVENNTGSYDLLYDQILKSKA